MTVDPQQLESTRSQLRKAMPVATNWAYFDHAAVAPISGPAAEVLRNWLDEAAEQGDTRWLDWARGLGEMRSAAAALLGAETGEIALVPNTTAGINLVAEGLDWQSGDNVVTLDDEFPANVYPWLNLEYQGVETRRVATNDGRVDLDQLAAHCDAQTRVVSVSWVGYGTGCRRDLAAIAELAHRHEALFLVDAIQGLGVFPLDVRSTGIDCLSADGHKWLLGPEGAGIAYVSHDCLARLRPIGVGWQSVVHAQDFSRIELNLKPTAARYEGGSHNMAGFLALGASIRLLLSLGVDNVAAAILDITDRACEQLQSMGAKVWSPRSGAERSGIVSFELPGRDPVAVRRHCLKQGVALNCRAGRLRISAHAYNDEQDLAKLEDALRSAT
ncbi:MAG: aminotransferase class V-fold PLP-dependent enzyme [Planctomycetales bacterium]|nr:aminotransferase class V-fold PLP-dependent enzyme [Planctomycetales bacterium]